MSPDRVVPRPPAMCGVPGCDRPAVARGWCPAHYRRWHKTGDARAQVPLRAGPTAPCSEPGCGMPSYVSGLCKRHYRRLVVA